jgi:hypothetical protein
MQAISVHLHQLYFYFSFAWPNRSIFKYQYTSIRGDSSLGLRRRAYAHEPGANVLADLLGIKLSTD